MKVIERNKNIAGRGYVMMTGLVQIIDGLVRIISFGHFHTRLPVEYSKEQAKKAIAAIGKKHANSQSVKNT